MKARSLTFYIEPDRLGEVLRVVDELIVPIYRKLPGFVGLVVLRAEHVPRELIGLSVWDGDLAVSEEAIAAFREKIAMVSGASAATETFDVLRLVSTERS
jgi:hypothetical protein